MAQIKKKPQRGKVKKKSQEEQIPATVSGEPDGEMTTPQMVEIKVTISGASDGAELMWGGKKKPLTYNPPGNYFTSLPVIAEKTYEYSITVWGSPKDPWDAEVTDGINTHKHNGKMSPKGTDTTGDYTFPVT